MKTVKQEEPISRSRFIDCPQCKSRELKLKRTVQVGRCRSCHESYKIVTVFVKTGAEKQRDDSHIHVVESKEMPESTPLSLPSDSSLFGPGLETGPSFAGGLYGWEEKDGDSTPQSETKE